jgi:hypothetical protein
MICAHLPTHFPHWSGELGWQEESWLYNIEIATYFPGKKFVDFPMSWDCGGFADFAVDEKGVTFTFAKVLTSILF